MKPIKIPRPNPVSYHGDQVAAKGARSTPESESGTDLSYEP